MVSRSAIVVGHTGQDGYYLTELLRQNDFAVTGISSRTVTSTLGGLPNTVDICRFDEVSSLLDAVQPDEIYFLAAWHHSSEEMQPNSRETFTRSQAIHCDAFLNFLDAALLHCPRARIFYASSSHIFGDVTYTPQDENHPISPQNIYGLTKAYGMEMARYYREHHGLFVSCGILYNHESPQRDSKFLSQKIAFGAVSIREGRQDTLQLGNPEAVIDWGHAADYVRGMKAGLGLIDPLDFIIASGKPHTVREFAQLAFKSCGLPADTRIEIDSSFQGKPEPSMARIGDVSLLRNLSGWEARYDFEALVDDLVKHALANRASK